MNRHAKNACLPLFLLFFALLIPATGQAQTTNEPELPRTYLDTTYSPPTGNTLTVPAGGDLQTALNTANPGDMIVLQAGATYVGNFVLPNKPGSGWIVIRTSAADVSLPAAGTRVSPAFSIMMPKIISPNANAAMATDAGAHQYRFLGVEFGVAPNVTLNFGIITLGSWNQTLLDQVPGDLILDRCYVHGNNTGDISRGVALNSARTAIIDSYIANIHGYGFDTQAIGGWNGPGPYKIVNNYLEGAGENVMFGGADPSIIGLVPSDIEFRRNHCAKPLSWNPRDPSYAGIRWSVKNLFELKNAQRVLIDGNIFENNWSDAQIGTAILFTPRNQDGTAPWSAVQDVTFTNNIVRHTANGMNLLGSDNNYPSQQLKRIKVKNNLFADIGGPNWGGGGVLYYILHGTSGVTIDHNTAFHVGNIISADGVVHTGFVYTNNLTRHNEYGVMGSGASPGRGTLDMYFPSRVFLKNILAGGTASSYPADNFFPASLDAVGFVSHSGGNYRLADSSPYRNAGTDGKDIGADINAIEAAISAAPLNQLPIVSITVSAVSGMAPLVVNFACNVSDPDGEVVEYSWDFGDGQFASTPTASHSYQTVGEFTARLRVTDNAGATALASVLVNVTSPPPPPPPPATTDIVMYAAEIRSMRGNWKVLSDTTAAGGSRLYSPDGRSTKIAAVAAASKHYIELSFTAQAGVGYRLWVRGKADNNSPYNDSFYVQFSGSVTAAGAPIFRTGTTSATTVNLEDALNAGLSGWGWQDNGWGVGVFGDLIYFQTSGPQTLRIQPREDGFSIDQIVLSPAAYLTVSPGALKNDNTILVRP